ncbi:putative ubiquitin-protein ligase [Zopfochytrium polystomum]|nr:putative ubiquitin-protein ligase [Zopfochytrium polystomum]
MKKRFSNWLNKDTGSGGNGSGSSGGHGSQGTTRSPSQTPMPLSIPTNYISAPTSASLHSISSSAPSPNERSSRPTVSGNASNSGRSVFTLCPGLPDPIAVLTVDGEQQMTAVLRETSMPVWNQTFQMEMKRSSTLVIQIFDEPNRTSRNDQALLGSLVADHSFLGSALFRLDDAKLYNYQLLDANREPTGGTLSVAVKTDGSVVDDKRERKSSILLPNAGDILSQAGKIFEFKVSNLDHFVKPADRAPVRSDSTNEPSSPGSAAQVASFAYEDEIGPLPPGWEYRVDSAGRGYYVDHNSRKTTRERPPLGASGAGAPVAPTPPASPKLAPSASSRGGPSGQSRGGSNNVPVLPSTPTSVDSNSPSNQLRSGHTVVTSIISNSQNEHVDSSILEYLYAEAARRDEKYGPLPDGWELRITTKRNLVFVNHQTQTTTWNDPRLPTIASNNGVPVASAEFKERFKQKVSKFRALADLKPNSGQTLINVRRAAIFEDGRTLIMSKSPFDLRKKLNVKFAGEEGLDYGGLSREFFFCLSNEIFNPRNGLFEYTNPDSYTFQINAESGRIRTNHLMYFTFVGRVVGLAIFHNHLIPAHFTTVFYKTLLRRPITVSDLASVDPEMHRSLQWILSNPLGIGDTDDDGLLDGMTFTADETQQGVFRTVELCPGGASRRVTEENKAEYVRLLAQHRIVGKVREQFAAFERGLFEILPRDSLEAFDERELEVLLGGMSEIDLSDWKRFTTYKGYSGESDPVIQRFWRVIESWDNDKRARLLQFVTGTSRVPLSGFKELRGSDGPRLFCIERTGSPRSLPTSHTCFNRLDLPPYETMDILDSKLSLSITETAGFGQQ